MQAVAAKFTLVVRLALGGLLLWSSISKIRNPWAFLIAIYEYEILGPSASAAVAIVLPWLEAVLAVMLLAGAMLTATLSVTAMLSAAFVYALSYALLSDQLVPCGCFGGADAEPIGVSDVVRAVIMCSAATIAALATAYERPDLETVSSE